VNGAPIHATLVARFGADGWRGLLLRGPTGAGKSGLALALIQSGWRLVADDRVVVWISAGFAWGAAPQNLKGLLEVRGVGVVFSPALNFAVISAVIDAAASPEDIDRIPQSATVPLCGVDLPACRLDFCAASAAGRTAAFCDALRL